MFIVVQSLSHFWLFSTPWTAARQASLSFTLSWSCTNSCPLNWWCLPTISSSSPPLFLLPSIFPSIRVFSNESTLHISWPNDWSFSFGICSSNKYLKLISLRIDWIDLLAFQGNLNSLLQHHRSKASILWHSAFFIVQLAHPYMTTRRITALTIWTIVSKVMCLLFNMLSRFATAFLPMKKHLSVSWLQLPSAVILEPKNIKSVTVSIASPSICHEVRHDLRPWP